jgi:GNAT superfamily N-acetyltransferase
VETSLHLTPATEADLPAIVELMNFAYRGTGANASWNTEVVYIEGDRTRLALLQTDLAAHPKAFLLMTRSDEGTQGCVWLEPKSADVWYLGSLSVDPRLQKGGLGREILAAAERWAIDRGAKTVQMEVVNVRDTLIAWYERRGYRLTGETRPFPYGDTRFGKPRRDDLSFVILEKSLTAPTAPQR